VPRKDAKTKSIKIVRELHPGQRDILLRKILENHVNRLAEGNGQNQAKELCVLRYNILVPFLFIFFDLIFISSFFFFVYVIICLDSLGFLSFIVLSMLGC